MNDSNPMNTRWFKPGSVFKSTIVFFLFFSFHYQSIAQNDSPCECVQRWTDGAHWNEDGSINDDPNAPMPLGIIRCGSSAETQAQIMPGDCVYNPDQFAIDVELFPCIDPSTQQPVGAKNPTPGEPIIWLNLDVRPNAGSFQVQINDNSGDKIAWALYYSTSFQAGLNENGISGNCNELLLAACGVESSNTWNTLPVPNFSQPTNYYLAIWDQDADGDLQVNNFKARFGCGDADILVCNLEVGEATTECLEDTYTVSVPIMGINGNYVGYDPNATPTTSAPVCLTNSGTTNVTSGTIVMTYPKDVPAYNIQISIDANPDDDCPDPIVPENCGDVVMGDAPVCCEAPEITCPPDALIACEASIDPAELGTPEIAKGCGEVTVTHEDEVIPGNCSSETTILRTWTATDEDGNETSCVQTITVQDNTAPLAPEPPADITVTCLSLVPEMPELVATDNCVGDVVGLPSSSITGDVECGNNFTIERTWTFADDCGNTVSISQTINVVDDTAPLVPEPPEDIKVDCLADVPPGMDLAAEDGCEGEIIASPEDEITPGNCLNEVVIVRTWTFVDACDNSSSISQTITVKDETAPPAPEPPMDVRVDCADEVPAPIDLTASDNCDGDITVSPVDVRKDGTCVNYFVITRTWTFVDACGNTSSVAQTISVKDETAPSAPEPPMDVRVDCADDVPTPIDLTASDNCDGDITVSPVDVRKDGTCVNDFVITRTWTFVDACGNTSSVAQTISVKDETAPSAPEPPMDVRVDCADDVPAPINLTASDNCDGDITVSPVDNRTDGACVNDFVIVRTWTFVDGCGNTSSVSQKITVKDETAPSAPEPPMDVRVNCADDVPAPIDLTANDNCDGDITVSPVDNRTDGACVNDFMIVRTWTFVDACGNTSSVSQKITVKDETAPAAPEPPMDVRVDCADDVPAPIDLTASDNCDGDITVSPVDNRTDGTCVNDFVITRTWTFVDACGNTSSVAQTISVKDETAPSAPEPPMDVRVDCADDVPTPINLTAGDNCDGDITVSPVDNRTDGACANDFVIVRTWTFVDGCGNTSSVSQKITVKDETAPSAPELPMDVRVDCADDVPAPIDLTAGDNCDGDITVSPVDNRTNGVCVNDFVIVRTWTFVDACGNTSSVSQKITVKDETAPSAPEPPMDVRVDCADDVPAPIDLTASDNCDGDITVSPVDNRTDGACVNDFMIVRTWTFVDACGNTSSVSQKITVKDETAPSTPEPPMDVRVDCADDVPAPIDLTASDNCDGDITVSPVDVRKDGTCVNDFVITRTWTFVDACGNTSSVAQTINVKDETAPSAPEPPMDVRVDCADDVPAPIDLTASDNCDGNITVSPVDNRTDGACVNDFMIVRTWTFVDACGNTSSVSQKITVKDETAPSVPEPPMDVRVDCADDVPAPIDLTASDNCDGDITVSPVDVRKDGTCVNDFVITRTWTFVDACGNTSSVAQTISVKDETAPSAPEPPMDVRVDCADDVPAPIDLTASDNCDGDITVSPVDIRTDGVCVNDFMIVRTWTFVDACGNTSSISQKITVKDETAPVAPPPPARIVVQCPDDVPPPVSLTAIDNCDGAITVSPVDEKYPRTCENDFVIVRTWIFRDVCGNTSAISQKIRVRDTKAPIAPEPPMDVRVDCADDVPAPIDLTASDNCDGAITVSPVDVRKDGTCVNDFVITRTWTFVDACGNTSSVAQTISVKDETAPAAPEPPMDVRVDCADDVPAPIDLTASDNCDGAITVSPVDVRKDGTCVNDFVITRTWTFVDACGNTSSVAQTISVKDETAPAAPEPPMDVRVDCADDVPAPIDLTAGDNCDGAITVSPVDVRKDGTCVNDFVITRTWTFVDACGNTSSVAQTISVKDETAPAAPEPPMDVHVDCADDVPAPIDLTAGDNCDGAITVSPVDNRTDGACVNDFVIVRTWTFVDVCGNTSSVSQKITVKDETAPIAPEPPARIVVQCPDDVPPPVDLIAIDNCDGEIIGSSVDKKYPKTCENDFLIVRTWVFKDACGNKSTISQKIRVRDTKAPSAPEPPMDVRVDCADDVPAPVDLTATDNCDGDITVSPVDVRTDGECENDFMIVRTWIFVDVCGNTSSVSQKITVKDETAPAVPEPPMDVQVDCADDVPTPVDLTATDNCDGDITVSPIDVRTDGACVNDFVIVRTWTFVDVCGNTSSVAQTITVKDETPPAVPEPPADITVSCVTDIPEPVDLTASDNCSGDITVSPVEAISAPGVCADDITVIRTWIFVDECGNSSEVSQTITVKDETPPLLLVELGLNNLSCVDDIPPVEEVLELLIENVVDGCLNGLPTAELVEDSGAPQCIDGIFARTYSFEVCDPCGNCVVYQTTYSGICAEFCTLTQGGWGNAGGKYPWPDEDGKATTTEIITALIGEFGPIVIGDPMVKSLTIEDPECVLALLPGGGPSGVLPDGNNVANISNDCRPFDDQYLNGQGRLRNNLLAQTIALQLNIWYSNLAKGTDLGGLSGGGACLPVTWDGLPETVVTVQDLLDYVNLSLSSEAPQDQSLAGLLTEVVSGINEYFDGCRLPGVFEDGVVEEDPVDPETPETGEEDSEEIVCADYCMPAEADWSGNKAYVWGSGTAATGEIMQSLIDKYGAITLGDPAVRSLLINDASCVMTMIPGIGEATVLPDEHGIARADQNCMVYARKFQHKNGQLKNRLATQAIILQLNLWYGLEMYGTDPGQLLIGPECLQVPVQELHLPPSIKTVQDLLDYSNFVLSGRVGADYTNMYLTGQIPADHNLPAALSDAIAAVNAYFGACNTGASYQETGDDQDFRGLDTEPLIDVTRTLELRPNPAHDRVEITYTTELEGTAQLRIMDINGRLVYQAGTTVVNGQNTIRLETGNFGSGMFVVSIVQDSQLLRKRLVIVRD